MRKRKAPIHSLLLLIVALQSLFIGSIIFEQRQDIVVFPFIILFIFLVTSYFQTYIKEYHIQYDSWSIAIWVFVGSIFTFLLRQHTDLNSVATTACTGFVGAMIPYLNKESAYLKHLPAPIYCGAFIAMTNVRSDLTFILVASAFTFIAFIFAKTIMNGIGGKLGTLAFVGVVLAYLTHYTLQYL